MARHIVAVCVVCLLCADRLPCEQHFEDVFNENFGISTIHSEQRDTAHGVGGDHADLKAKIQRSVNSAEKLYVKKSSIGIYNKRRKRHAVHDHSHDHEHDHDHVFMTIKMNELSDKFLQRIFDEYGQKDGTIHFKDFRRMLKRLGLQQLIQDESETAREGQEAGTERNYTKDNETCITDRNLVNHLQRQNDRSSAKEANGLCKHQICSEETCKQALVTLDEKDSKKNSFQSNYTLQREDLYNLCPVLLYQLSSESESERSGCIDSSFIADIDCVDSDLKLINDDTIYKWCYAFMSVLACSILGLVGVAIIPFMDTRFYKHIIQFFVALAVGTMTGDALLHLMPHSLAGQSETNMIFKGLTCMGGIIFFYITEHGLTMISEWRRRIEKQEQKKPSRAKIMHDPDSNIHNSQGGDKLCKSKYSSYPYCYDEIAMAIKKDDNKHHHANDFPINCSKRNSKVEPDCSEATATQSLLANSQSNHPAITEMSHNAYLPSHHHNHLQQHHSHCPQHVVQDSNTITTDIDGNAIGDAISILANGGGAGGDAKEMKAQPSEIKNSDTVTVILREHESSHHGHSHKHGHVHSPPTSLSAVAWMIIMGDGLHNFTDGMAIGAAFAENVAGGFSTSLAVFCHELPHELGDFAILIKAGMTVKSAVYYNLMTGILSFIGMFFGMIFGQSPNSAQWMFAAAAGLFIYIALVDMLPELSTSHKSIKQLVLQVIGMSCGVLIMLLIAIYEGDLMTVFATSTTSASVSSTAATSKQG